MQSPPQYHTGLRSRIGAIVDAAASIITEWAKEDPGKMIAQVALQASAFEHCDDTQRITAFFQPKSASTVTTAITRPVAAAAPAACLATTVATTRHMGPERPAPPPRKRPKKGSLEGIVAVPAPSATLAANAHRLAQMGFEEASITSALSKVNGNLSAAIDILIAES